MLDRDNSKIHMGAGLKFLIVVLVAVVLLNNSRISESTRNRDNISSAWEALTKDQDFFSQVKDKDLFISTTYNDAYQINVADFYLRTKIRLAAFVWPGYVWTDFQTCNDYKSCPLGDSVNKISTWLVNISKGDSKLRILSKEWKFENDWPTEINQSGALSNSNFWYFNVYMITQNVGLAYLIPVIKSESNLLADLKGAKVFLTSSGSPTPIRPLLNGVCMTQKSDTRKIQTTYGEIFTSKWQINQPRELLQPVDLRTVSTGTC